MSLQVFIPSTMMGKHCHHESPDRPQPNKASSQPSRPTSTTSSLLAKALFRGRESNTPQTTPSAAQPSASENPAPTAIQPVPRDPSKPARATRVPAITSKAMTTAPVRDKSRPHRRKYPTNMRQRH